VFDNISYFLDALWILEGKDLIPFSEFDSRPKPISRKRR